MFIIGNRGAAGEKPENTLASIRSAIASGVPMITVDVRITKDGVPILMHDDTLERTHKDPVKIKDLSFKSLKKRTAGSSNPLCTLNDALHAALPQALVFLNLKDKKSTLAVLEVINTNPFKRHNSNIILSSSSIPQLLKLRTLNKHIKLALMQKLNPFAFLVWERRLGLTAVGFHRLHATQFAIEAARSLDIFAIAYTVNRTNALTTLSEKGFDAVITDFPSRFMAATSDTR